MMFCPDCGTGLDDVSVSAGCPGCGGARRSVTATAQTAVAIGVVPPARVAATSNYPDGSRRLETGSIGWHSGAHSATGGERQRFSGRPPRHEDDVLEVCELLRTALGRRGLHLSLFVANNSRVDDVDATAATADGDSIRVQVVRAEQDVWKRLGRDGEAGSTRTDADLAREVLEAVKRKQSKYAREQRAALILAVDAIRAPGFAIGNVLQHLLSDYHLELARAGFRAIWLVGPTQEHVHRLVSRENDDQL